MVVFSSPVSCQVFLDKNFFLCLRKPKKNYGMSYLIDLIVIIISPNNQFLRIRYLLLPMHSISDLSVFCK